jgi:prephenate dehydratase
LQRSGEGDEATGGARLRVAFLGPEGTFTEEALFSSYPAREVEPVAEPTVYDCVMAVDAGRVDRAIVPIENSLEGSVNATLDALVFETDRVSIVGEVVYPIQHCLIAREQLPLEAIERVISHPQASAQCSIFIRERLPDAEVASANSTADAVRLVAESNRPWAALGNRLSADLYACQVLQAGVEDRPRNKTRFVWLARRPVPPSQAARQWKTSAVFWGLPDSPGALVNVLQEFAVRNVNLSKIESRPLKQELGRYIFFADLEGREDDPSIVAALEAVGNRVDTLRVLGCYPAAGEQTPSKLPSSG